MSTPSSSSSSLGSTSEPLDLDSLQIVISAPESVPPVPSAEPVSPEAKQLTKAKAEPYVMPTAFDSKVTTMYTYACPHCKVLVQTEKIQCGIFRHGVFKGSWKQIPPHLPKAQCDALAAQGKIVGCGKPYQLTGNKNRMKVSPCEYK